MSLWLILAACARAGEKEGGRAAPGGAQHKYAPRPRGFRRGERGSEGRGRAPPHARGRCGTRPHEYATAPTPGKQRPPLAGGVRRHRRAPPHKLGQEAVNGCCEAGAALVRCCCSNGPGPPVREVFPWCPAVNVSLRSRLPFSPLFWQALFVALWGPRPAAPAGAPPEGRSYGSH